MTRLKFNVGSMNIFNTIFKNIQCFRLKYGFKISNEIQCLELSRIACNSRKHKKAKIEYEI